MRSLLHGRLVRGQRLGGLDVEARVLFSGLDDRASRERLRARARRVRDPRFGLLLRQLRARLVDQRRAIAATRGVIQHRERCTHVAPGGRALRPAEHQPFALRPDLRGQECYAHVVRIDGTGLVGELLGGIQMVLLQLGFGVGHQMIDDLFKSVQGARVTRIALQRRAIQFGGTAPGGAVRAPAASA